MLNPKLDFKDVLICPKKSNLTSRKDVDLFVTHKFKYADFTFESVPIIAANMDGVGTIQMANTIRQFGLSTALTKHYTIDELKFGLSTALTKHYIIDELIVEADENYGNLYAWYSMGTGRDEILKLKMLNDELGFYPKLICIDVANGYTDSFLATIKEIRLLVGETSAIMAGNVVTPEQTKAVIKAGADIVKVGIGPGSVCTTRKLTGVGYPQLSAVLECAKAAHKLKALICSDGGCVYPGDIAKAFGAGADFVMLGGMLAGHDESDFEIIEEDNGNKFVYFYGMSSDTAMNKHAGGVAAYRASEGKTVKIPYKGKVSNTVQEILGGLRSTCTYVGAKSLKELKNNVKFIRVNNQLNESLSKYES